MEFDPKYASASIRRYAEAHGDENINCERNGQTLSYSDILKEGNHNDAT